jgi:signal transduction histidine kinase
VNRLSLRARFTLLTGLTVLAAGALLLGGAYLLAAHTMASSPPPTVSVFSIEELEPGRAGSSVDGRFGSQSTLRLADGSVITAEELKKRISATQRALAEAYRQQRTRTLHSLVGYGGAALAGIGALAISTSWLLAGRLLGPLHAMTRTTRRIAASPRHLGQRVAPQGPADEVRTLAEAFDIMLERLDRAFDGQRRFVANASHELRTPLAINRAVIEVALDEPDVPAPTATLGRTLLAVNARHERLIEALLTLATSEQEVTDRTRLDLADVAAYVVDEVRPLAAEAGVRVRLEPGGAPVAGDPVLLERLATNLVANGVRYNHPEGRVTVSTSTRGGMSTLEVVNTGPVVPSHEAETLCEPFRRLSADDGGFGLGLSIVRAIARAHGGDVSLQPREAGGLTVRVALPGA